MFAMNVAAVSLVFAAVAYAAEPSDKIQFCGASLTAVFAHPACDVKSCITNWPKQRNVPRAFCFGDKKLQHAMDLCCVSSADEMLDIITESVASVGGAPVMPKFAAPRVPTVPHKVQQPQNFGDNMFQF